MSDRSSADYKEKLEKVLQGTQLVILREREQRRTCLGRVDIAHICNSLGVQMENDESGEG